MEYPSISSSDQKSRFGGLLENPTVSKIQRAILDAGRVRDLKRTLGPYGFSDILDVGCGLGEGAFLASARYAGLDNSYPRLCYAARRFSHYDFVLGDARCLPFRSGAFDLVMLIDTSHHLSDEEFRASLDELKRVSRSRIFISDPVLSRDQSAVSRFFYGLDRGGRFRHPEQMRGIMESAGLTVEKTFLNRTFPGLYLHAGFLLRARED